MSLPSVLLSLSLLVLPGVTQVDEYLNSAHGSPENGVLNPIKAREGFAQANCSHCHVSHAETKISGSGPGQDKPYPYTLYALNFDSKIKSGVYSEPTDFCFSCHNTNGSSQPVANKDISQRVGCSTLQEKTDILGQFNQMSRHNLYDIWQHLYSDKRNFSWFTKESNPCSACHNSHLARNHSDNPRDISFSSLSKPSDHANLWLQSMYDGYTAQYEPPFCSNPQNREPAASTLVDDARKSMLDYVSFCLDCHSRNKNIQSSTLERKIADIDWGNTGDIHGGRGASTALAVKPPYLLNSQRNYVLSCLDCHEAHGSSNTALIRTWVNGDKLLAAITTPITIQPGTDKDTSNMEMGYLCLRCHVPDPETGTGTLVPPTWLTIHHGAPDTPYVVAAAGDCTLCHAMDPKDKTKPMPINCINCHYHGSTDDWLKGQAIGKPTF